MKKLALLSSLLLLMGTAVADTTNLTKGDAAAGKAKAATCVACHGADGNSLVASFPKLAGQGERYLIKQMHDIKNGDRVVPTMAGQLDSKSDQDIADMAAYFASQPASLGVAQNDKELLKLGEQIYRVGNEEKGIAACSACHSPTGQGNDLAGYPHLAGQHADYTALQLKKFRSEKTGADARYNDGDTRIMRDTAYRMSDKEIEAVANYIAGLRGSK